MPLSITAIASWCVYDNWLATVPVDDAVPMLFRMGTDGVRVNEYLADGGDFRAAEARHSFGLAIDEMPAKLPSHRRVYLFSPGAWSRELEMAALKRLEQWR
jgi:hypothetical protein